MGRPKSRQAPRTTMSIRVSERERREIEEKAAATGMTPSAYIRTMALDGGNVDTMLPSYDEYVREEQDITIEKNAKE